MINSSLQKTAMKFVVTLTLLLRICVSHITFTIVWSSKYLCLSALIDLTYLPAHLSPHALVLCAPATLFFPEFFSGRVPAHLGENMQSPYLSYLCLGQLMLPIKSPFKYHSHSTLNLLEVEEQD